LVILLACAASLSVGIGAAALGFRIGAALGLRTDFSPGIGDPKQAKIKIKDATTKDEVLSLLGPPHSQLDGGGQGDSWTYRCDFFGGTLFRVHFGPDDRVKYSEWWLQ
jgi:hypothetical protein